MSRTLQEKMLRNIANDFKLKHKVPFILKLESDHIMTCLNITLEKSDYVNSSIVNISDNCRDIINGIAAKYNCLLSWNNTGSIFWVKKTFGQVD